MSDLTVKETGNLALKYRPKLFKDLVGQSHIANALQAMIDSKKIHQSILLHGLSGHGKTTSARILARYLNCKNLKKNDEGHLSPCGECQSCQTDINKHPDVIEINAANARGIDEIRQLIRSAQFSPLYNFKVFILDELHQLTPQAMEAFLKPLEEPPKNTVWVLCTTNPEKLKPTIRGRCKQLEVKPLKPEDCAKMLFRVAKKEGSKIPKDLALKLAQLTNSQPRESLQALSSVLDNLKIAKKANEEDLVKLIADVISLPPWQAASNYLTAVYSGSYSKALVELESTSDSIPFMKLVVEYHYKMCKYWVAKSLREEDWISRKLYETLGKHSIPPDLCSFIMSRLVKCNSMVNEFQVDAKFVIGAATLEIIEGVNKKLKVK